jgi:hypothetical protein
MKETILGKLRDLWAIRRRCQQIKVQQNNRRPLRTQVHGRTQGLSKIILPKKTHA